MFLKRSVIVGDKLQFLAQIRFLSIDTKGDGIDNQKTGRASVFSIVCSSSRRSLENILW